jgi:pimeloyl-ACP methyl ester carboxylesterase
VPHTAKRPRLWYEQSGHGEPLLLITGFTISSAVFEPVLPLYEPHFTCVRYDIRGAGRSDPPTHPTSMPELAHDSIRVLDTLGIEHAHVCGVSMGGMIAQEIAIRYPERVLGLVLGGTTPGGPRAVRPALGELLAVLRIAAGDVRDPGRSWLATMLFSPEFRREHPERTLELIGYFKRHRPSLRGVTAQWWATVYHDTVSRLGQIQAPTLVMHGEHDPMSPLANAEILAERIPDAELAIVRGAGHAFALERPEESLATVTRWLGGKRPVGAGRRREGLGARVEPLSRALGLPIGAFRTGASVVARGAERINRKEW